MRKIVAGLFISLDGVVETPENWGFSYINEEVGTWISKGISEADAVLLGPSTYHKFAKMWPSQGDTVPMAKFLNESPKYVMSHKPDAVGELTWEPTKLLKGTLSEEIAKLKALPGKNIQVPGSPRLVRSLLQEGLLDELNLGICPVVLGKGLQLFDDITKQINLEITRSKVFDNGLISVTYHPTAEGKQGQQLDFPDAASKK